MKVLLLFLLFNCVSVFAQADEKTTEENKEQVQKESYEYAKKIRLELSKLKDLAPENYFSEIDKYRSKMEKYFEYQRGICKGEFSTVVLEDIMKVKSVDAHKKLNKQEQKLCYLEMKSFQTTFVNNMFMARTRYLNYLHKNKLKDLEKARLKAIESLNKSFSNSLYRR